MTKSSPVDVAITALAPMVWGSTYFVTTELLPADRPLLASTLRALPAGLLLMLATRTVPRGVWWVKVTVLGALNIGLFFFLLFVTAYQLPGGVAALVMSVQPLFVLLLGVPLLRQRIKPRQLGACALGSVGVGLLVLRTEAVITTVGVVAGLAGALSSAAGIVLTKRWGRPPGTSLIGYTGLQLAFGGLLLVPATLILEDPPAQLTVENILGYGYLAVLGALFAYAVWFRGIERIPAVVVSVLVFFSPLTAIALGFVLLGETLAWAQIVVAALVLASVFLVQHRDVDRSQDVK